MHCKSRSMLVGKYTAENSTKKEAYVKGTVREQPKAEGCGWRRILYDALQPRTDTSQALAGALSHASSRVEYLLQRNMMAFSGTSTEKDFGR